MYRVRAWRPFRALGIAAGRRPLGLARGGGAARAVDVTPELTELSFKLPNKPTLTSPEPELAPSTSGTVGGNGAMRCCVAAAVVDSAALAGVQGAGIPLLRQSY
eukprot:COSAG02_NODE_1070_length_14805_cov_3.364341_4_plen_104_part_00